MDILVLEDESGRLILNKAHIVSVGITPNKQDHNDGVIIEGQEPEKTYILTIETSDFLTCEISEEDANWFYGYLRNSGVDELEVKKISRRKK